MAAEHLDQNGICKHFRGTCLLFNASPYEYSRFDLDNICEDIHTKGISTESTVWEMYSSSSGLSCFTVLLPYNTKKLLLSSIRQATGGKSTAGDHASINAAHRQPLASSFTSSSWSGLRDSQSLFESSLVPDHFPSALTDSFSLLNIDSSKQYTRGGRHEHGSNNDCNDSFECTTSTSGVSSDATAYPTNSMRATQHPCTIGETNKRKNLESHSSQYEDLSSQWASTNESTGQPIIKNTVATKASVSSNSIMESALVHSIFTSPLQPPTQQRKWKIVTLGLKLDKVQKKVCPCYKVYSVSPDQWLPAGMIKGKHKGRTSKITVREIINEYLRELEKFGKYKKIGRNCSDFAATFINLMSCSGGGTASKSQRRGKVSGIEVMCEACHRWVCKCCC